jgi:hypothetical protein
LAGFGICGILMTMALACLKNLAFKGLSRKITYFLEFRF